MLITSNAVSSDLISSYVQQSILCEPLTVSVLVGSDGGGCPVPPDARCLSCDPQGPHMTERRPRSFLSQFETYKAGWLNMLSGTAGTLEQHAVWEGLQPCRCTGASVRSSSDNPRAEYQPVLLFWANVMQKIHTSACLLCSGQIRRQWLVRMQGSHPTYLDQPMQPGADHGCLCQAMGITSEAAGNKAKRWMGAA